MLRSTGPAHRQRFRKAKNSVRYVPRQPRACQRRSLDIAPGDCNVPRLPHAHLPVRGILTLALPSPDPLILKSQVPCCGPYPLPYLT